MSVRHRIISATPLISTIIFLTIGFTTGVWHPTWAVFFLILIIPVLLSEDFYKSLYPIAVAAIYLSLGFTLGIWHPLWIIFLTIPVYYIIFEPVLFRRKKKLRVEFVDRD